MKAQEPLVIPRGLLVARHSFAPILRNQAEMILFSAARLASKAPAGGELLLFLEYDLTHWAGYSMCVAYPASTPDLLQSLMPMFFECFRHSEFESGTADDLTPLLRASSRRVERLVPQTEADAIGTKVDELTVTGRLRTTVRGYTRGESQK